MELSLLQIGMIGAALIVVGAVLGRFIIRTGEDSFLGRVFKSNKDLDSTLDRVSITTIILFMLISFHDDFVDPIRAAQITIIFMGLINLYQSMVTGKAVRDMQNGNGHKS